MAVFSSCFFDESGNGVQLVGDTSQELNFADSAQFCRDINLEPALFTDETITKFANDFIELEMVPQFESEFEFSSIGFWNGLQRDAGSNIEARSFRYIDGSELANFARLLFRFPWFGTEPNDDINQPSCVVALVFGDPLETTWFDVPCTDSTNRFPLCQRSCEPSVNNAVVSSCFEDERGNGLQLIGDTLQKFTFDGASKYCRAFNLEPALFTDETITRFANDFIENEMVPQFESEFEFSNIGFWNGLQRDADSDNEDPRSFRYSDGTEISNFALTRKQFPWFLAEPGNGNINQPSCVEALVFGDPLETTWFDGSCTDSTNHFPLCQRSCELPSIETPTATPTTETNESKDSSIGIIVGPIVALIALAVVVLAAYSFIQRRQDKKIDAEMFKMSSDEKAARDKAVYERNQDLLNYDSVRLSQEV